MGLNVVIRLSSLNISFLLGGDLADERGVVGGDMNVPADAGGVEERNNDELDDDEGRLLSFLFWGILSFDNFPSGGVIGISVLSFDFSIELVERRRAQLLLIRR